MPFDGVNHGAAPLLQPRLTHPGSVASHELLSTALAGAYGYARTSSRQLGTLLYRYNPALLVDQAPYVWSTSLVTVGVIEGYVPTWATHIGGEVIYWTESGGEAVGNMRITTGSDSGVESGIPVDLGDGDEGGGALLTSLRRHGVLGARFGVPAHRVRAEVELDLTTLGDDVAVTLQANLQRRSGSFALPLVPWLVTAWWEARDG